MTRPRTFGLVWLIVIFRGIVSPGRAPAFRSSVLAVMAFLEMDVLLLLVSLFPGLAPVVGGESFTIWKLCELVVMALDELRSLGTGLSGGRSTDEGSES